MALNLSKFNFSKLLFNIFVICAFFADYSALQSINTPLYYKADFLFNLPLKDHRNFVTNATARYAYGSNSKGWGINHSRKTNILEIYGDTNVSILGVNVEGINPTTTPLTYKYLDPTTGIIPSYHFTGDDGVVSLKGKFKINEFDLDIQQNIFLGFFAYLYMPIRWIKIDDVRLINHTSPSNPNAANFQAFLDNDFNGVLNEWGLYGATTPFNKHGLGDVIIYVGWQGYNNSSLGSVFHDLNGSMKIGAILPSSSTKNHHEIVSLSTGYNGHYGLSVRAQAELGLKEFASFGAYVGVDVLQYKRFSMHLRSDKQEQGLIFLQNVWIHEKLGTVWQVGGYVNFDRLIDGLNVVLGYSFSAQERTTIKVHDKNFLKTFIEEEAIAQIPDAETRNSMIRGDPRFRNWNQQVFHFSLMYDFRAILGRNYSPSIAFYFDYPIMGKLAWTTTMIGGSAGINAHWEF